MFGKRKFHRGTIEGRRMLWVLGGICRCKIKINQILVYIFNLRETGEFFLAICPENKRNKETLNKLILDNVAPGNYTILTLFLDIMYS